MPPPRAERFQLRPRWLALGACVALAPKCFLCVAAYIGMGTALGLSSRELCGASSGDPASRTLWLIAPGIILVWSVLARLGLGLHFVRLDFGGRYPARPWEESAVKLPLLFLAGLASAVAAPTFKSDIEYGQAAGESLKLDVSVPEGAGPFPAVILVHGGSWSGGDKTGGPRKGNMAPMHGALNAGGIAWFSINYRLAPQHRYPAGIEDVETAIRWIKAHAAEYRVDPKRLALSGDSSGGHYVALAAVRADASTRVAAIVPFFTPFDFVAGTRRRNAVTDTLQGLFGRTTVDEETYKILHDASPLYFVKPGLPPFLILQGTADTAVIPQQAIDMEARLREAGVPVERIMVEGGAHGMSNWTQFMPDYKERVVAWLNKTLAAPASATKP